MKEHHVEPTKSLKTEIDKQRRKLQSRLKEWHSTQMGLMPKAGDMLIRECPSEVEDEKLYLPSDFPSSEREANGFALLGSEEVKLREGEAFDALQDI